MPYRRKGKVIYHKKGGKWSVKQRCNSVPAAKRILRYLKILHHFEGTEIGEKARRAALKKMSRRR